ncbi:hypothetical protein CCL15_24185 [Pseudomonas syringae]|nr:hypothetical protein CCL15_24185 [Pseudomonas syringae]
MHSPGTNNEIKTANKPGPTNYKETNASDVRRARLRTNKQAAAGPTEREPAGAANGSDRQGRASEGDRPRPQATGKQTRPYPPARASANTKQTNKERAKKNAHPAKQ